MSTLGAANAAAQMREYRKRVYLNRGPIKMSSRGVARRLQALHALGWTTVDMAAELGVHRTRAAQLMNGIHTKVYPATARDVSAMYEKLSMLVPADSTDPHTKVHVHQRARNHARRRGYVPPLVWDDIDLDDQPRTGALEPRPRKTDVDPIVVQRVLDGDYLSTTLAERHLIVTQWLARGGSEKSLCGRMGWCEGRYGTEDLGATG